jgi:hypothetical protein
MRPTTAMTSRQPDNSPKRGSETLPKDITQPMTVPPSR